MKGLLKSATKIRGMARVSHTMNSTNVSRSPSVIGCLMDSIIENDLLSSLQISIRAPALIRLFTRDPTVRPV